jgi:hypothetical protein
MDNVWLQSALWIGPALLAAAASMWVTISAALFEIVIGAVVGNTEERYRNRATARLGVIGRVVPIVGIIHAVAIWAGLGARGSGHLIYDCGAGPRYFCW